MANHSPETILKIARELNIKPSVVRMVLEARGEFARESINNGFSFRIMKLGLFKPKQSVLFKRGKSTQSNNQNHG
jgi:hypothetical protein